MFLSALFRQTIFIVTLLFCISCEDQSVEEGPSVLLWGSNYSIEKTTRLDLWNRSISGQIPSSIGKLINLSSLDLSYNQLVDSIPKEIGDLGNLTSLNLSYNKLSGPIPMEIGNLVNLVELDLGYNMLTQSHIRYHI